MLIVGDGSSKSILINLRDRLGLEKQVTLLGQRDDVKELLEVADIFVFPSMHEGCPNALIEAMAMGKPCVASRIGPIEEVMEDGVSGVLVPTQSPEILAQAVVRLSSCRMEEALEMGQRARTEARQRFTAAIAVGKLENFYQRVACDYYGSCK